MPYDTKTVIVNAEDGTPVPLTIPTSLPSDERADYLRDLFSKHVKHENPAYGWKGPCHALVPATLADDVADAMDFMGAIVDDRKTLADGQILVSSRGYYAHGF